MDKQMISHQLYTSFPHWLPTAELGQQWQNVLVHLQNETLLLPTQEYLSKQRHSVSHTGTSYKF